MVRKGECLNPIELTKLIVLKAQCNKCKALSKYCKNSACLNIACDTFKIDQRKFQCPTCRIVKVDGKKPKKLTHCDGQNMQPLDLNYDYFRKRNFDGELRDYQKRIKEEEAEYK